MNDSERAPESAIAQSFAADLDDMFGLSTGQVRDRPRTAEAVEVADLTNTVHNKKQTLTTKDAELQELEARLKAAEERLAKVSSPNNTSTGAGAQNPSSAGTPANLAQRSANPVSSARPPTQREDTGKLVSNIPGAMPQTPGVQSMRSGGATGSGDYVMVDQDGRAGAR